MKKIAALIDFTPITDVVVDFAKHISLEKNTEVALVSIVENESDIAPAKAKVMPYCEQLEAAGVSCFVEIKTGVFLDVIAPVLNRIHAEMAVIGTHGKRGLKQNLFGSNIMKLVLELPLPSLVVQETSKWPEGGFQNVLFPIASHSHFELKTEQTKSIMNSDAKITLYAIYKTDLLDDQLRDNLNLTTEMFKANKIKHEVVEEDVQVFSVGYSRQTLVFASQNKVDMISIMSQVSKANKFFGIADKENIILNPEGIPVLCCNDDKKHF